MALKLWANKGQATLELAIFGSILIMLLGILVNYGLKYNFQQQVMMQTFRRTLGLAADRRSATYILVKDHHIPDPSNPFGVGSIVPVISTSSVTRDYRMQETADNASELPRIDIETPDGQVRRYKTAAFRDEYNIPESDLSKYEEVYGPEGIGWWVIGDGECGGGMVTETNPQSGEAKEICLNPTKNIRIIDNCAGEIMSYETVQMRCKKIKEAGINVPWYCDQTEALFAFSDTSKPAMGLQQDYTQDTTINNTLNKQESTSGIRTQDTLDWQITTQRTIVYNDGLDSEGVSTGVVNVIGDEEGEGRISSSVGQDKTYEWETRF